MTPVEVLHAWFDAHRRGDMDAARELLAPNAPIELPDRTLVGLDALLTFFAERREQRPDFSYEVYDVLAGEHHAAAVLAMHDGDRHWRQVAVYTVRHDRIASIWAAESDAPVGS